MFATFFDALILSVYALLYAASSCPFNDSNFVVKSSPSDVSRAAISVISSEESVFFNASMFLPYWIIFAVSDLKSASVIFPSSSFVNKSPPVSYTHLKISVYSARIQKNLSKHGKTEKAP